MAGDRSKLHRSVTNLGNRERLCKIGGADCVVRGEMDDQEFDERASELVARVAGWGDPALWEVERRAEWLTLCQECGWPSDTPMPKDPGGPVWPDDTIDEKPPVAQQRPFAIRWAG